MATDGAAHIDPSLLLTKDFKCTELKRKRSEDILKKYPKIFIQNDLDGGYNTTPTHKINIIDSKPVSEPNGRIHLSISGSEKHPYLLD